MDLKNSNNDQPDKITHRGLILASGSPRRAELLSYLGLDFKVLPPQCDESHQEGEPPSSFVKRLSQEKALWVMQHQLNQSCRDESEFEARVLMSADTIVFLPDENQILGKPKDQSDAKRMLKKLSGSTHIVYTGYSLSQVDLKNKKYSMGHQLTRCVQTQVKFIPLTETLIEDYIQTKEGEDKAGAYAAQGIGMNLIESIDGSYSNVIGLPLAQVLMDLKDEFKFRIKLSKDTHSH